MNGIETQRELRRLDERLREMEKFAGRFPVRAPVGGGGAGNGLSPFRIKSISNNYLTCRTWDGTNDGATDVLIAKPFLLRHVLANYASITSFTTVNAQQATIVYSGLSYTWKVTLPYAADEVIWAHTTSLADVVVASVGLIWEDANVSGHAWAVQE